MQWAVGAACAAAAGAGYCAAAVFLEQRRRAARRGALKGDVGKDEIRFGTGVEGRVIAYTARLERRIALGATNPVARRAVRMGEDGSWRSAKVVRHAGFAGQVTRLGYAEACIRLGAVLLAAGFAVGLALSTELAFVLAASGGVCGASLPKWAFRSRSKERSLRLERELPDMLDVVALGLRSGLSFDRSLALYCGHFESTLALECSTALDMWSAGLASRKAALERVAEAYDSPELARAIDTVVRSLRLGTALAERLEEAAHEARSTRKARREESVAKASVKMMIPTGTLILPAMLIMVVGPVLLELMAGW